MQLLDYLADLDERIFRAFNLAGTNQALDAVMVFFTVLGFSYVIVLVCVPLWLKGRRDLAFDIVVLVILASFFAELVKTVVDRPRPLEELPNVHTIVSASGASFPSGHATRAFAVAMILALRMSKPVGLSAIAIAFVIALSRVYLGVHWPSDLLGGALLGIFLAFVVREISRRSKSYRRFRSISMDWVLRLSGKPLS